MTQENDWDALYGLFCSLRRAQSSDQGRKVLGFELQPGPAYGYCGSEASFRSWVKATALPYFHLCGTCRMGSTTADSVVDSALRVHGIRGLRVADASVAPRIPSAPIQAMVAMVGYRASSLIVDGS
jgi:choline dehydrogenase